mmetsp:Transcript_2809/g.4575  ORF Transcript_2809/g.4575 Transcript_2809/m.4575 type:complete len:91 (+) Transcript_2809:137-409(+)
MHCSTILRILANHPFMTRYNGANATAGYDVVRIVHLNAQSWRKGDGSAPGYASVRGHILPDHLGFDLSDVSLTTGQGLLLWNLLSGLWLR